MDEGITTKSNDYFIFFERKGTEKKTWFLQANVLEKMKDEPSAAEMKDDFYFWYSPCMESIGAMVWPIYFCYAVLMELMNAHRVKRRSNYWRGWRRLRIRRRAEPMPVWPAKSWLERKWTRKQRGAIDQMEIDGQELTLSRRRTNPAMTMLWFASRWWWRRLSTNLFLILEMWIKYLGLEMSRFESGFVTLDEVYTAGLSV